MDNCGLCSLTFDDFSESIVCDGVCGKAFHSSCVGVPVADLEFFKRSKNYLWVCDACGRAPAHTFFDTLALYKGDLDNLKSIVHGLGDKVNANSAFIRQHQQTVTAATSSSIPSAVPINCSDNSAKTTRKGSKRVRSDTAIASVSEPPSKRAPSSVLRAPSSSRSPASSVAIDPPAVVPTVVCSSACVSDPSSSVSSNAVATCPAPVSSQTSPTELSSPTASICAIPKPISDLRVVPKPCKIFITRFSPDTTCEDVLHYISSKKLSTDGISCRKLSKQTRPVASFLLSAPPELQDVLLDQSFWPPGTFSKFFEPSPLKPSAAMGGNTSGNGFNNNKKNSIVSPFTTKT